jgi:hypothetical protein
MSSPGLPRLARLVFADWDEAPEALAFQSPWGRILEESAALATEIGRDAEEALSSPATPPASYWEKTLRLFVRLPAIVNVMLNWKICVEQGLPLHPTLYFEVNDLTRNAVVYPEEVKRRAAAAFLASIPAARALLRLDPEAAEIVARLSDAADPGVRDFVFTSVPDKYTWRACDPSKILSLASRVAASRPEGTGLVVGAAHGSLLPGMILAEALACELYFLRFSMFKRNDTGPVVSESDLRWLAERRELPALVFDEDVAKGTTLRIFTEAVAPLFDDAKTASVIRHGLAAFRPDFAGVEWFD